MPSSLIYIWLLIVLCAANRRSLDSSAATETYFDLVTDHQNWDYPFSF